MVSKRRGFILIIVIGMLGVLVALAVQLAGIAGTSHQIAVTDFGKTLSRMTARSGMEFVLAGLQNQDFVNDDSWMFWGEDTDMDGVLDPGEDVNGDGLLNRFSAEIAKSRRCSYPVMSGGSPALKKIDGVNRSYAIALDSRFGDGSLVVAAKIERLGQRMDLISQHMHQPMVSAGVRSGSAWGTELNPGPGTNPTREIWMGDHAEALGGPWQTTFRPDVIESVQEYFFRRFTAAYVDSVGPNANNNGFVDNVEWESSSNMAAAAGNVFFHPVDPNGAQLGRRMAGASDIGWRSWQVHEWLRQLNGEGAEWSDYFKGNPLPAVYNHDPADAQGHLTLSTGMSKAERDRWISIMDEYFTINKGDGIERAWTVPFGWKTDATFCNNTYSNANGIIRWHEYANNSSKPASVGPPENSLIGRLERQSYLSINDAPEILIAGALHGIQGTFQSCWWSNYETRRTKDDLEPMPGLVYGRVKNGATYQSPPINGGSNYMEITLGEAKAMAAEVVARRPINDWKSLHKALLEGANSYLFVHDAVPGAGRYQRAEILAEMAMASLNPEFINARMIQDGPYPLVSFDASMLTRINVPASLDLENEFIIDIESVAVVNRNSISKTTIGFTTNLGTWFKMTTQAEFENVPTGVNNDKVISYPENVAAGLPASTWDGSLTIKPVDEGLGNPDTAAFSAMFTDTVDALGNAGSQTIPPGPGVFHSHPNWLASIKPISEGGVLFPDGLMAHGSQWHLEHASYDLWTASGGGLFPFRGSTWTMEFWVKIGYDTEALNLLGSGDTADHFTGRQTGYVEKSSTASSSDNDPNYRVGGTLIGIESYRSDHQYKDSRYLKLVDGLNLPESNSASGATLNGQWWPEPYHLYPQSGDGTDTAYFTQPRGLALWPVWGGKRDGTRNYAFVPDYGYSFGSGSIKMTPGEWHHVAIHHSPADINSGWYQAWGLGTWDVVIDGADDIRWGSYSRPANLVRKGVPDPDGTDIVDTKPTQPAGPYDPAEWAARAAAPPEGETWKYFSDGGWPNAADWDDPIYYNVGWYPGSGRTTQEYVWAYVVGWNYNPPGDPVESYWRYHNYVDTPPSGGPPGNAIIPGTENDELVHYLRSHPAPEPAVGDFASNGRATLVFNHRMGFDYNKIIDNVVIYTGGSGWSGGAPSPSGFPQRFAPKGGRPLDERPTYRNEIDLPGTFAEGTIKKIKWTSTHPWSYSGRDMTGWPDGNGKMRYPVDLRVFVTDNSGNILGNPGTETGWDGSGVPVNIPVQAGKIPFKVVFYNGNLPDWGAHTNADGSPWTRDQVPVCIDPGIPDPLNVENISARLYSVSFLVNTPADIRDFRMD